MSRIRTTRGALLEAYREVGKLRITHPDPDAYDKGFNEAVDRALQTIEVVAGRLAESRALRENTLLAKQK